MLCEYPAKSLDIQARLMMLGFQPNHLMLMGAFVTIYGMFETTLERALWALCERSIEGVRPCTETMSTEAQFKVLGEGSTKLSDKCNAILRVAAHAAEDLNEYGRLNEFIGVYNDMEVFDPAVDIFVDLINKWMADYSGQLQITHDRSKPLKRNEPFLRTLMKPLAPQTIGYGDRQAELPLRVSHLEFDDSVLHPQLQVADLVAGAVVDCLLSWSGKRPLSEYHEAMKESRLAELVVGGMLPSPTIVRKNEPNPGEMNLVDGSTDFLKKAGYFDN